MYKNTVLKTTSETFVNGLPLSEIGTSLYNPSSEQRKIYEELRKKNGVEINVLPENLNFPDVSFVEDIAVITPSFVVISNSDLPARMEAIFEMEPILNSYYGKIYYIQEPGTLEGEDVLQFDNHFYIGVTSETNLVGAQQLQQILQFENYKADIISHKELLHLKKVMHN
jgi:dimethylargininase